MIRKILYTLFGCIAIVLILGAFQPKMMSVSREMIIVQKPSIIFPYINNAQKSYEWMPWAEGDPSIEIKFSGPAEGIGSISSWEGKEMGVGKSEVTESVPDKLVITKLVYTEPFHMTQTAEISLTPKADGTLVKWSINGQNNYFFRVMSVFMDCDEMIGSEFKKGLSKLKSVTESKPQ